MLVIFLQEDLNKSNELASLYAIWNQYIPKNITLYNATRIKATIYLYVLAAFKFTSNN